MRDLLRKIPVPDGRADSWQGTSLPPEYHNLTPKEMPCWFVDGGNAEILGAPHFTLQQLRAVALRFPDKKIIRQEKIVLLRKAPVGWELLAEQEKSQFIPQQELSEALTVARQQLEHAVAHEAALSGELVVLDGDVAPSGCVALQKTATMLTDNNFPLSSVLLKAGPWYATLGRTVAVKLDSRARHVFLVYGAQTAHLQTLAFYATDAAFPGYPWGLMLVDRLARVSNEEAQALRVHAKAMLADLTDAVARAQAASDSHSILDNM